MPSNTMRPFTFCTSVECVFAGSSSTNGNAGETVQVNDEARPAPLRLNSAISSSSRAAPCSMVSTPASRPARTPSALSMCAAVRRPSLRASSQAACATSGDMRSTPGSPSTSASNTPPVMNSFTRSHLCAKQSRTMARASSGVDATCANRPAPWPPGTVTPTPDATSRGPGYLPASMASRTSTSANPGSPTERTVVTPLASCCCACALSVRRRYHLPNGLPTTLSMRSPAAPALVGLPEPHRCTCRFTRPGARYAPARSISRAPNGPTVEAAGPTFSMTPSFTTTVMLGCGSMPSVPSSTVAWVKT